LGIFVVNASLFLYSVFVVVTQSTYLTKLGRLESETASDFLGKERTVEQVQSSRPDSKAYALRELYLAEYFEIRSNSRKTNLSRKRFKPSPAICQIPELNDFLFAIHADSGIHTLYS
jgi:hypothetical protein